MLKFYYEKTAALSRSEQSAAAYNLLRSKLAEHFCTDSARITFRKDEKGCPFVEGIDGVFISVTHTDGLVACAFADSRVGVDAEKVSVRRKSVEKRIFTDGEISLVDTSSAPDSAFFALWTLKESYLKAIGTGFSDNAKTVEFFTLENPIKSNKEEYTFDTQFLGDFAISVCQKTKL